MSNATALLVIDVQLGLFQRPTPLFNAEPVLTNINDLIGRARANGVPVIFIQHNGTGESLLRPDRPGWALHPAIVPLEGEPVISKDFPNAFQKTILKATLKAGGINKLIIAGLLTDNCVGATSRGALKLGYPITLVADGHSTFDREEVTAQEIIDQLNREIEETGGQVKTTAQVTFA